MTTLLEYLTHKRTAFRLLRQRALASGYEPLAIRAEVTVEGRSGVRRIRLRDHQVLSDSPRDFVGYDLGPSSPELALGALGSCLAHSWLIQAAAQGVPLRALEVRVSGQLDQRAAEPGHEDTPREPHGIAYTVHVESDADAAAIDALHASVERLCPVLNLLRRPQAVAGSVHHDRPEPEPARSLSPEGVA